MDFNSITRILEDYRARGYYPSAVCQVFDKNGTLYHRSFGEAAPDSWFDLASVSKLLCTTMLLFAMELMIIILILFGFQGHLKSLQQQKRLPKKDMRQ